MSVEYARNGLVGVLTPQANTTVEPEFAILWPAGVAMINARLMSPKDGLEARLLDYFHQLDRAVEQFHNAPVGAMALACTGASYLAGAAEEQATIDRLTTKTGVPFLTAGRSVEKALRALQAKRIALVSPYPPTLTDKAIEYWASLGFETVSVVHVGTIGEHFHPIYSIRARGATEGLDKLEDTAFDAVIMLGTGMPTLQPILERPGVRGAPVLSCMLALGWAASQTVTGGSFDRASLLHWISGAHWRKRLEIQQGLDTAQT
jgi:maleate isomerase